MDLSKNTLINHLYNIYRKSKFFSKLKSKQGYITLEKTKERRKTFEEKERKFTSKKFMVNPILEQVEKVDHLNSNLIKLGTKCIELFEESKHKYIMFTILYITTNIIITKYD